MAVNPEEDFSDIVDALVTGHNRMRMLIGERTFLSPEEVLEYYRDLDADEVFEVAYNYYTITAGNNIPASERKERIGRFLIAYNFMSAEQAEEITIPSAGEDIKNALIQAHQEETPDASAESTLKLYCDRFVAHPRDTVDEVYAILRQHISEEMISDSEQEETEEHIKNFLVNNAIDHRRGGDIPLRWNPDKATVKKFAAFIASKGGPVQVAQDTGFSRQNINMWRHGKTNISQKSLDILAQKYPDDRQSLNAIAKGYLLQMEHRSLTEPELTQYTFGQALSYFIRRNSKSIVDTIHDLGATDHTISTWINNKHFPTLPVDTFIKKLGITDEAEKAYLTERLGPGRSSSVPHAQTPQPRTLKTNISAIAFGQLFQYYRQNADIKQEAFGTLEIPKTSQTHISTLEHGRSLPDIQDIHNLQTLRERAGIPLGEAAVRELEALVAQAAEENRIRNTANIRLDETEPKEQIADKITLAKFRDFIQSKGGNEQVAQETGLGIASIKRWQIGKRIISQQSLDIFAKTYPDNREFFAEVKAAQTVDIEYPPLTEQQLEQHTFGQVLKYFIRRSGKSYTDVGRDLDIPHETVSTWILDKALPAMSDSVFVELLDITDKMEQAYLKRQLTRSPSAMEIGLSETTAARKAFGALFKECRETADLTTLNISTSENLRINQRHINHLERGEVYAQPEDIRNLQAARERAGMPLDEETVRKLEMLRIHAIELAGVVSRQGTKRASEVRYTLQVAKTSAGSVLPMKNLPSETKDRLPSGPEEHNR